MGPARAPRANRLWGPSSRAGRAGQGRHAFLPGPPDPGRGVRGLGKRSGDSVGARWVRASLTRPDLGGMIGVLWEGCLARVGSRQLWIPARLRCVSPRQGEPFPGPFTRRKASPDSCETNAPKSRTYNHRPSNTRGGPRGGAPPAPVRRRGRGPSVMLGGIVCWKAWWFFLGSRQGVWGNKKIQPQENKRNFTLTANWCRDRGCEARLADVSLGSAAQIAECILLVKVVPLFSGCGQMPTWCGLDDGLGVPLFSILSLGTSKLAGTGPGS